MIIRYGLTGILFWLLVIFSAYESMAQKESGKIKCICIDAGHGGFANKEGDPGAIGALTQEKHLTLGIALKLGKMISERYPDIRVVYTRTKDVPVELNKRGKIANDCKADLFISIHINSCKTPSVRGLETYVLGSTRNKENLEVAMKENAVIRHEKDYEKNYAGFDPTSPESYIIFSLMQNIHQEKSLELAGAVQAEMVKATNHKDRGVRQAGYLVLKDATMPAILVESGFISNREDEKFLMSQAGQTKIATAIFKGIETYKRQVEKKSSVTRSGQPGPVVASDANQSVKAAEVQKTQVAESGKNELFYAIQVASVPSKVKTPAKLCTGEKVEEINSGGRYRYYVAKDKELDVVKKKLSSVKRKVKDCFIIAIYNNKVITVAEARKLESEK